MTLVKQHSFSLFSSYCFSSCKMNEERETGFVSINSSALLSYVLYYTIIAVFLVPCVSLPLYSWGKKRNYFSCNVSLQVVPNVAFLVVIVNSPDRMPFMPSDDGDGGDGQKKQVVNPHVELRE